MLDNSAVQILTNLDLFGMLNVMMADIFVLAYYFRRRKIAYVIVTIAGVVLAFNATAVLYVLQQLGPWLVLDYMSDTGISSEKRGYLSLLAYASWPLLVLLGIWLVCQLSTRRSIPAPAQES